VLVETHPLIGYQLAQRFGDVKGRSTLRPYELAQFD